jgi:hypothetical protein
MTATRARSTVLATVALAASATLGLASAATAAEVATYPLDFSPGLTVSAPYPDYVLDVDCDEWVYDDGEGGYGEVDVVWVPGGSLTVNFTCEAFDFGANFIDEDLSSGDYPHGYTNLGPTGGFAESFTVAPNTEFTFLFDDAEPDEQFIVNYVATLEIDDPSGGLILTEDVSTPADGAQSLDFADGGDLSCSPEDQRVYGIAEFTVLEGGEFTFRVVDVSPLQSGELRTVDGDTNWWTYLPNPWGDYVPIADPYLVLYSDFDPAAPNDNQIACNDDIDYDIGDYDAEARDAQDRFISDVYSELIVNLEPGEYTLLLTTYDEVGPLELPFDDAKLDAASEPVAPVSYQLDGLPEQSATIEFWGVEGGLELGHAAQLADTGANETPAWLAGGALLALVLGALSVMVARRRTA